MAFGNIPRTPQEYARRQQAAPVSAPAAGAPPIQPGVSTASGPSYGNVGPGAAAGSGKGMDPTFRERLMAMIAASGGRLTIKSGFRSVEEQTRLWNVALQKYGSATEARKWVAPPGRSNHNHGIAADLGGDLQWAHDHAAEFGLYFPMGHEPWHVEPTGSRSGKAGGWAGPKASAAGYTTPRDGYGINDDPGMEVDPRKSLDYQMTVLGALLGSPEFVFGDIQLPDDFTSMPMGTR